MYPNPVIMSNLCTAYPQERILRCITDPSESASEILGLATSLQEDQMCHVLSLRGLLAYQLTQHCLQKRHCVQYGVSRYVRTFTTKEELDETDMSLRFTLP